MDSQSNEKLKTILSFPGYYCFLILNFDPYNH